MAALGSPTQRAGDAWTLTNMATGAVIAHALRHPRGWYERTRGLLHRGSLGEGEGIVLDRCWGIHTVGMRFPIDVLFLEPRSNSTFELLSVRSNVRPGRVAVMNARATFIVEVRAGTATRADLLPGDLLALTR